MATIISGKVEVTEAVAPAADAADRPTAVQDAVAADAAAVVAVN